MHHGHIPGHAPGKKKRVNKEPADEEAIEEGLQAIYGDDRSDLHVMERDTSRVTRALTKLVFLLAAVAILAYGSFFVYTTYFAKNAAAKNLSMAIQAPAEVRSGETVEIVIDYANPSRIPLASLELDVNLPSAFVLTAAQPQPTDADDLVWKVGSLGPHSDSRIVLEGVWLSQVPSTTTVQALATYRPSNFNSYFSDIATTTVTTLSSVLALELSGPEAGVPGQELTYTAEIKNTGTQQVRGVSFALGLPEGFILSSSEPLLNPGAEPVWEVGDLAPEASTTVTWNGSFAADVSDVQQFEAEVRIPEGERTATQATGQWFTDVTGSAVRATLVVNGNTNEASTEVGGALRASIRLENAGEELVSNASVLLDFQPESGLPIVWNSASLAGGKLTAQGVAFDAAVIGVLAPGDKKTFNLSFPIVSTIDATHVDSWTMTAYVTVGDKTIQTAPFPVTLEATADLSASARFFSESGAPIGDGALPPKVGQTTSYRAFWSIGGAVHDLEDVTVTATLPPDVSWNDRVLASLGNVSYDEASKTVRWTISVLPAGESATAEFTLQLTPGEEDVGTFVKLLSGTILSATDAKTGGAVESEAEAFTTEIPNDTFAAGKGTVID